MKNEIQVSFYSISYKSIEKSLIKLIEKIYDSGKKLLLKVRNKDEVELFDRLLWTYTPISFLAHGNSNSGYSENQPIFITSSEENLNNADIILIYNEADETNLVFSRIIYFYSEQEEKMKMIYLDRLEKHKRLGHQIKCWHQDDSGSWVQVEQE